MGWLSGWKNRVELTIDGNKIESDLTDFPMLVTLSSGTGINNSDVTSIFDELGSNSKKIAVTTSDGDTQCYTEIERWDAGNEQAWLWTRVPTIASGTDTQLYLYYDNSHSDNLVYVGDVTTKAELSVNIGAEGTYDTAHSFWPCVIKDGSTYKMWRVGHDGTNMRILYCTSVDGVTWFDHQLVVNIGAEGTYDTTHVHGPCVIKDGSIYKMWYTGYDGTNYRAIYCTSIDGVTWSNHQMVIDIGAEGTYDTSQIYTPFVIKDGSTYKMWYTGSDGSNNRIIYCTSTNGTTWSNYQMVINIGSEGTYDTNYAYAPRVIKDDSTYKMWYSGHDGSNYRIIYCTSTNGTTWSNYQMIINISNEGTYDTAHSYGPFVMENDSIYKMWYIGHDGTNGRILYTTSHGGINWGGNAQMVWDSNYVGVWHMSQDPSGGTDCIKDSASYRVDGTPNGSMISDDLMDGKIGKAINFDGNNDYIDADDAVLTIGDDIGDQITIEAIINSDRLQNFILGKACYNANPGWYSLSTLSAGEARFSFQESGGSASYAMSSGTLDAGTDHYLSIKHEYGDSSKTKFILNGFEEDGAWSGTGNKDGTGSCATTCAFEIAHWYGTPTGGSVWYWYDGKVDEVRVSNCLRPDSWLKATYYSNWDSLLTFGQEEIIVQSLDTNQVIHGNPYYNASSTGVEIYNLDISNEYAIAYVTYSGGINTISLYGQNLYMGTNDAGIWRLPTSTITGTNIIDPDDLTPYISQFKDYPGITDNHVKYIHSSGDYMCIVTASGVDHFNFGSSDSYYRSHTTISGVEKCWQTSTGKFYYIKNTIEPYTNYIYDEDFSSDPSWTEDIDESSTISYDSVNDRMDFSMHNKSNDNNQDYFYGGMGYALDETISFTLDFKVYPSVNSGGGACARFGVGGSDIDTHGVEGVWLEFMGNYNVRIYVVYGTAQSNSNSDQDGTWSTGNTYYCRLTSNGSGLYTAYVWDDDWDGSNLVANPSFTDAAITWDANRFGICNYRVNYGTTHYIDGWLDDARLGPPDTGYIYTGNLYSIYTHQCDWDGDSVGYKYYTTGSGNLFFPEQAEINDIAITEGTSTHTTGRGNTNNVLFIATTSGITLIEEKQGDEENSRYKQYTTASGSILRGNSSNFVAVVAEPNSTFDNTNFAAASYGSGAGLNVVYNDELKLFWPSTVDGAGNTIRQDASDMVSVE